MIFKRVFSIIYFLLTGIIINAFITVIDSMQCDEGWLEYEGICLNHYSTTISWAGADGTCSRLRDAQLVTVDSQKINSFVHNNLTRLSDVWIGLSIPDIRLYSWKWSDGNNIFSYNDWNDTDINSACAVMKYNNSERYWYSRPCTNSTSYICEKEMRDGNCSDWLSFDTRCYLIITESTETNMAAARNCWHEDAYLISINSQQEAEFIYRILEINIEYWIGLSPLKWVSGVPYQWNNWGDSGPNITNRCVYMDATSGKWFCEDCGNSFRDDLHRPYICKRDAVIDFPSTPTVDVVVDTSTNTVLGEPYTHDFVTHNISTTQSSTGISKQLLLTAVIPAVCGGLVVIIVIIVVVIVIRRKRRTSASRDAKSNQGEIYYNDSQKTRENDIVKATDTNQRRMNGTNRHVPTEDSPTPSAGDTERNTYEQLSVGPYVNSGQFQAGTYASLQ